MDQLRGSAASSNLLSATFTFFAGQEDANREGLPFFVQTSPGRDKRMERASNPFAIEGESGKKTTNCLSLSADFQGDGGVPPYAPRH